jgi:AraC-like DNA-binding protein
MASAPAPAQRLVEHKLEEIVLSSVDADSRVWAWLDTSTSRRDSHLVRDVEAQMSRRRTVAELARASGRSLSTFKRRFRELTGQTPAAWIRERRLERARLLLQTTDRSVTDVALEVGFTSVSHFVHAFRLRYRVTPQRGRKNQKRQSMNQSGKT